MCSFFRRKQAWFSCLALSSSISLSIAIGAGPACFADSQKAGYEVERAVYELCLQSSSMMNSSNYSGAIDVLRRASLQDPNSNSALVHADLAVCYRELHKYPESIKEGETALKFDPRYGTAYYTIALCYFDSEHYDTASIYLRKLLQVTNDNAWRKQCNDLLADIDTYGRLKQASKQIDSGHLDEARKLLLEAAKYDPSRVSANVHSNLAYVYRQTGKPEQAIEEGKKSLQFKPDNKEVEYALGIAYQDIGQFSDAISWLQRYQQHESDPTRRKLAQELISDLRSDQDKLNDKVNSLPDYLDHMVGGDSLRRWPQKSLPIKVHVMDGKGVSGFRTQFPSYIARAMDTWCNASGNKLSYKIVPGSDDADIDVYWISKPVILTEGSRNRIKQGVARPETDDGEIKHVRVEIDTMNGFEPTKPLDESECASVCMHEIGHALGLDHSTNYADIMYFGASSKQTGLPDKRDRATIARLYAAYPVSKLAPIEKAPAPMKFLPPPGFIPPKPPGNEDLTPPLFLPPPIAGENENLVPPFFKPQPLPGHEAGAANGESKAPAPPLFVPPPKTKQKDATEAAKSKTRSATNKPLEKPRPPLFLPEPPK